MYTVGCLSTFAPTNLEFVHVIKRSLLLTISLFSVVELIYSQHYTVSGKVFKQRKTTPVEYALISLPNLGNAVTTDEKGAFVLHNLPAGPVELTVSSLGYATKIFRIVVEKDTDDLQFYLPEDNLALNEVVVTAQKKKNELGTTYRIGRAALDQMQVVNVTEIAALLPGGQTSRKSNLATDASYFSLRSNSTGEIGKPGFGTVVEVDGVRLSNNASFQENVYGVDTRNISAGNIESVEITTGIPSVEYGDLSNGMVRIRTRKGKSPLRVELSMKPNTKSISIDRGFDLGADRGLLNAAFERTRSNSDLASPYTTYDRNVFSLNYIKTLNAKGISPLRLNLGLTGNVGGYDSKADPDAFKETYTKQRDNALRANLELKWQLNKSWISSLDFVGTVNYSDQQSEVKTNKSNSSSIAAIHATDPGYYLAADYAADPDAPILLLPVGYWYEVQRTDSKPLIYTAKLKANWTRRFGQINTKLLVGADYNRTHNEGRGTYYTDMSKAPTWREYRYDEQSAVNNLALYGEDELTFSLPMETKLFASLGLRADLTHIADSEYGTISSLSPRMNLKYLFWNRPEERIKEMSLRVGLGDAVKLPTSYILRPIPSYTDKLVFAPGTLADGTVYYAYNTLSSTPIYNPDLKWQRSRLLELEYHAKIGQIEFSLTGYYNKIIDPYVKRTSYIPYSYNQTNITALDNNPIPSADRAYSIDPQTGIVTVSDKTGAHSSQQLAYVTKNAFKSNEYYANGSDASKKGVEWIVDFGRIPSIRTSFRVDGAYNFYKGFETDLVANTLGSNQTMADGNPYKYIGLYEGSSSVSNGSLSKKLTNNLTITTHIPAIRLLLSLRIESTFYNYSQQLSRSAGLRAFPIDDREAYFPSSKTADIASGNNYVAVYPLYYVSMDDMDTRIPFAEKFARAKTNDPTLFNELAKLVVKTNTAYYFKPSDLSAYYSANLNVTKELGDHISISFLANNFLNTMSKVKNKQNDSEYSLYNSSLIPEFYYGLTLRIKL